MTDRSLPTVWIDGDSCPREILSCLVALARERETWVVFATSIYTHFCVLCEAEEMPPTFEPNWVAPGPDAVDKWILSRVKTGDVVVTVDVKFSRGCRRRSAIPITPIVLGGSEFPSRPRRPDRFMKEFWKVIGGYEERLSDRGAESEAESDECRAYPS